MTGNFLTYRNGLWFKTAIVTTVLLVLSYAVYSSRMPAHGGTVVGLVYGSIGLAAILLLMYYGMRKRSYYANNGSLQHWLSSHIYLGLLTLLIIPMHAGFHFGFDVHTLAFVLMAIVVVSGMVGTYLYLALPRQFTHYGAELAYEGIDREFQKIVKQMRALCQDKSDAFVRTCEEAIQQGMPRHHVGWQLVVQRPATAATSAQRLQDMQADIATLPETEHTDFQRLAVLSTQKQELEHRLASQMRLKNVLEAWLYIHLPVSIAMLVAVAIHIIVVLYY
jgi:hypothetical protein